MPLRTPVNFTGIYDATSLITHLSGSTLTVCVCAYITPTIGSGAIGITSLNTDLTGVPGYVGVTFKSTTGVTSSKVEHPVGTSPANMETDLFLIAAGITEADVLAGKWSHAQATIFITNYEALDMGQLIVNKGFLSEFRQMGQMLTSEVRGFNQALTQQIGKVTRPECDADFGDARCGLDLSALGFIKTGTLTAVTSQLVFTDTARTEGANYFDNGKFQFTSGNNNGYTFHVDSWNDTTKTWTLRTAAPYLPQVGDAYSATRGCRKNFERDCVTTFSNAVNFRGFPHVPTVEALTRLPLS